MHRDPYLLAAWRENVRKWRSASFADVVREIGLPVVAVAVLTPLVRRTFLTFLDGPPDTWGPRMTEVVFRANVLALSVVVLDLYEQIVRGRERQVLQILPVDPARVARLVAVKETVSLLRYVAIGAALLAPIGLAGAWGLWAAAVASLAGCALLSVPLGIAGHLLAIRAAEAPSLAPILDLVRGNNPRPQAAFLYAPGVVLLAGGGLLRASAVGAPGLAEGTPAGAAWVALPVVAGIAVAFAVPALARAAWFRGSAVVAEIDARYAALEDPEEALRVYLDWGVRFLPAPARVYALADLRHGWRARRTAISLVWVVGLTAVAAGWTADADGPFRAAVLAAVAPFLIGANGVWMDADVPELLRVVLPRHPGWSAVGRAAVLVAWSLPAPLLAAAGVAVRQGPAAAAPVLVLSAAALVGAVALSAGCGRLRERGMRVYAPTAAVVFVALVGVGGGRG